MNIGALARRTRRTTAIVIGIVALAPIAFGQPHARAESVEADSTTDVACASEARAVPTTWYFPSTAPLGLVWLQHGVATPAVQLLPARHEGDRTASVGPNISWGEDHDRRTWRRARPIITRLRKPGVRSSEAGERRGGMGSDARVDRRHVQGNTHTRFLPGRKLLHRTLDGRHHQHAAVTSHGTGRTVSGPTEASRVIASMNDRESRTGLWAPDSLRKPSMTSAKSSAELHRGDQSSSVRARRVSTSGTENIMSSQPRSMGCSLVRHDASASNPSTGAGT